jgi:peptidyl-prolyl cis-trans isomerase SurA
MNRFFILICLLAFAAGTGRGQTPFVLTVGDENVSLEEFRYTFQKNNRDSITTAASLDEYMELYINFKLKVKAAVELGMDTSSTFLRELAGYRKQLSRPYLVDNDLLDELVTQAYERLQEEIRARHILVKCSETAAPEDTLKAWNKTARLRDLLIEGGDFEQIARGKSGSEDPSVKDNRGDLGWFTAFQMLYPFEDAAYTTEVGELSGIIRTRYGYHILEVTGRRKTKGEVHVAHIMVRAGDTKDTLKRTDAENRAHQIYNELQAGADWTEMAMKYSEDQTSSGKGGDLKWMGIGRMVEEFETAVFALTENGEISAPFATSYGWHIAKRIDYRGPKSIEESEKEIRRKVQRDLRAEKTRSSFLNKLKEAYGFKLETKRLAPLVSMLEKQDSAFTGDRSWPQLKALDSGRTLVTIGGEVATVLDFRAFLETAKLRNPNDAAAVIVNQQLDAWVESLLFAYEDGRLEEKHSEFRMLMEEYRDGILLFELTDELVWTKAVKDSSGLANFYAENTDQFLWPERADIRIFTCADNAVLKAVKKALKKGDDLAQLQREITAEQPLGIRITSGLYTAMENDWAKQAIDAIASGEIAAPSENNSSFLTIEAGDGAWSYVEVRDVHSPEAKTLEESRGQVIAGYQDELERLWIAELRGRYRVEVYTKSLHSLAD